MSEPRKNLQGALLGLLAMAIYAAHDAVVKTLGGDFSAVQIIFFAALLSFPVTSVIMLKDKREASLRPVHPGWLLLRSICMVVTGLSAFYAFTHLPLAQVYPILFAAPLLVTVLSIPLLGEIVRLRRWLAVIVGLIGVVVVVRPGQTDLTLGHVAAMTAAVCSALASVIVRKIGGQERSIVLLLYPIIGNFAAMGMLLPFVYQPMSLGQLSLMGVVGVFGLLASFIIILAYRAGEAVIVAPMQYSQIIWAVFYGYVFFNEGVDQTTLLGAGIVIASGMYIVFREGSGTSANQPVLRTRWRGETPTVPRSSLILRLLSQGDSGEDGIGSPRG